MFFAVENLLKLFDAEFRFMSLIWALEPVNSTELTRVCEKELGWKKPTTYSMIKKLCDRGILKNEKATVTALIKQEDVQKYEADLFMDRVFGGSVPSFVASFLKDRSLSPAEAQQVKSMIDEVTEKQKGW